MNKRPQDSSFPVDLVYMWVDGSDPVWRAKRAMFMPSSTQTPISTDSEARWRDNDELKYSLRSVERYAPWVNHIYIITDRQCPKWLNKYNPKVSVIDHSQIMPNDALPTFNSCAIESCIYRIPGLSEHFIVGNDDTIFCGDVSKRTFFLEDGTPIVRLVKFNRRKALKRSNYTRVILRMQNLVYEHTSKRIYLAPHHNFDAYRKSDFERSISVVPELWRDTSYHRFRSDDDMQRCFVSLYAIAMGRAAICKVGRYNRIKGMRAKVKAFITNNFASDSRCVPVSQLDYVKILAKYNPLMICVNDGENTSDADREKLTYFLEYIFPQKSSFEL